MQLPCLDFIKAYKFSNILVEMGRPPKRNLPASFITTGVMFPHHHVIEEQDDDMVLQSEG
jgi:hypothetical protein